MKKWAHGDLTIYSFTNEYQIYGPSGLLRKVFKTVDRGINEERLTIALAILGR